jgi:hypothetical protein
MDMREQPARIGFKVWANGKVYYLSKLYTLSSDVKSPTYQCDKILVNGD